MAELKTYIVHRAIICPIQKCIKVEQHIFQGKYSGKTLYPKKHTRKITIIHTLPLEIEIPKKEIDVRVEWTDWPAISIDDKFGYEMGKRLVYDPEIIRQLQEKTLNDLGLNNLPVEYNE